MSHQLRGFPLLFSFVHQPIHFVNGNGESDGYDGRDTKRTFELVTRFFIGRSSTTPVRSRRLRKFYQTEFSVVERARGAFKAGLARRDDANAEGHTDLIPHTLDETALYQLHGRYEALPAVQDLASNREDFSGAPK